MTEKPTYYDGTKLLSMKDINGDMPEIFICTSNNSAGKTTYFNKYAVNRFLKHEEKFCLLYRYSYESKSASDAFFKEIGRMFFPGMEMTQKSGTMHVFDNLYINGAHCGYAVALNLADKVKRISHLLADSKRIIFDEFILESGEYLSNELTKFRTIHKAIARGDGEQSRYLPVIMIGNPVSKLNPYYVAWNIPERLRDDTKFLRGEGWVLEQGYNESADIALSKSAFNRAFGRDKYNEYSTKGIYMLDSSAFLDKPDGAGLYLATIKFNDRHYAIRSFENEGVIYVSNNVDMTYPLKLSATTADHDINYVMINNRRMLIDYLRDMYEHGCLRFQNMQTRSDMLKILCYK